MSWLRGGDNAATYPAVMALAAVPGADDRTLNEVFGFVMRCALQSAGHMTDYYVDLGTAQLLGNGRHEVLLRQAVKAGLLTVEGRGKTRRWKLIDDPEFIHIRLRDEVEWERRRKRDGANPDLTMPVRLRDGDACRYCVVVVNWRDRRGARGGTYDHLDASARKETTPDRLVVACRACNSSLKAADAPDRPLLPPPDQPYYSPTTRKVLEEYGYTNLPDHPRPDQDTAPRPGRQPDTAPRPATQADTATATPDQGPTEGSTDTARRATRRPAEDPARRATPSPSPEPGDPARGATPGPGATDTARGATRGTWKDGKGPPPEWAPDLQIPAGSSRKEGFGPGRVGSGRNGSGVDPPVPAEDHDHPPPPTDSPDHVPNRRRARRGRKP